MGTQGAPAYILKNYLRTYKLYNKFKLITQVKANSGPLPFLIFSYLCTS